jgi:hypothetical protein
MADKSINITRQQQQKFRNAVADYHWKSGNNVQFIEIGVNIELVPSSSPTPSVTPSFTMTPTVTQTPSTTISITPTRTPSNTITPTVTMTPTSTATPSNTITPSNTATPSLTQTPSNTPSITATPSITSTPSNTASPSYTPSQTQTPSNTVTPSYTPSNTTTPTVTQTPSNSMTPSVTPTATPSPTPSITPSSSGSGGIVTSGLVFNLASASTSGTTWTDATGNGYNATLNGASSYTSSFSGGIQLANANNYSEETGYISVPYNITSSAVTVEMVASFNPTDYWGAIWGNEVYDSGSGYFAYMDTATSINYGKSTSESSETVTASDAVRHWVFVINGTSHSLYLNGSQVGTTDTVSIQTLFASNNFYFGARHTNAGTGFTDVLNNSTAAFYPAFYQMRVYGRGLSSGEITQNFNAIKGTYGL